ncbi:MAG: pimeloyl-ACP methyl ester esterase BioH [Gammaproteobacteria bacterium]|nr:pimeloyl-ACP methyl ester esterase BioH [Gammaproteobacteria bacterium]
MTELHIESYGSGQPLVLVHGWAMHSGIWGEFALELAKHYRIILVDLPGHGRSAPIASFTLETIASRLIEAVAEKKCSWLGWSLGAQVVLQIAHNYPDCVDKLMILTGTPCFVARNNWPGMAESVLDSFAESLLIDREKTLLRFVSLQVKDGDDEKTILKHLKQAVFAAPFPTQETLLAGLNILKTVDLRQEMTSLMQPVCAILGSHDALVPAAAGQAMQRSLPSLQLYLLQRAGHTPFLTHSQQTAAIIRQFMDI